MQKFGNSLRNAITISKESIKRDGIGKYYLFFMLNFLFNISLFLSPFRVSKWEMANEMKKGNKVSITNIYDNASGKRYFNQLQANVLKIAIFTAVILIIAIIGAGLFFVGTSFSLFSGSKSITFYWSIPAILLLTIFVLIVPYIHVPNSYISNAYPSLSPSSVLRFSFYAYKNGGKVRMLLINLLEWGLKILLLLPFVVIALILFFNLYSVIGLGFMMLFLTLGVVVFIAAYPFLTLPALLMRKELFDEIVFVKNSNKFEASFDFEVDSSNTEKTLNNIFGIEEKEEKTFSSIEDKYNNQVEIDKKSKKKEKLKKEFDESEEQVKDAKSPTLKVEKEKTSETTEVKEDNLDTNLDNEEIVEDEQNDNLELELEQEEVELESEVVSEPEEVLESEREDTLEQTEEVETAALESEITEEVIEETVEEPEDEVEPEEEIQVVEETAQAEEESTESELEETSEDDEFSDYINGLKEGKKEAEEEKEENLENKEE